METRRIQAFDEVHLEWTVDHAKLQEEWDGKWTLCRYGELEPYLS